MRPFFYLLFMHSESLIDQERSKSRQLRDGTLPISRHRARDGATVFECGDRGPLGPRQFPRRRSLGVSDFLWESPTFSDDRVLLHIPSGTDPRRPAVMLVFFHGHGANLAQDVYDRQQVPAQTQRGSQRPPTSASFRLLQVNEVIELGSPGSLPC